jgi:hypothetical protein
MDRRAALLPVTVRPVVARLASVAPARLADMAVRVRPADMGGPAHRADMVLPAAVADTVPLVDRVDLADPAADDRPATERR